MMEEKTHGSSSRCASSSNMRDTRLSRRSPVIKKDNSIKSNEQNDEIVCPQTINSINVTPKINRPRTRRRLQESNSINSKQASSCINQRKESCAIPYSSHALNSSFSPFASSQIPPSQDMEVIWDTNSPGFSKEDLKKMYNKSGLSTPSPIALIPNRSLFTHLHPRPPLFAQFSRTNTISVSDALDNLLEEVNKDKIEESLVEPESVPQLEDLNSCVNEMGNKSFNATHNDENHTSSPEEPCVSIGHFLEDVPKTVTKGMQTNSNILPENYRWNVNKNSSTPKREAIDGKQPELVEFPSDDEDLFNESFLKATQAIEDAVLKDSINEESSSVSKGLFEESAFTNAKKFKSCVNADIKKSRNIDSSILSHDLAYILPQSSILQNIDTDLLVKQKETPYISHELLGTTNPIKEQTGLSNKDKFPPNSSSSFNRYSRNGTSKASFELRPQSKSANDDASKKTESCKLKIDTNFCSNSTNAHELPGNSVGNTRNILFPHKPSNSHYSKKQELPKSSNHLTDSPKLRNEDRIPPKYSNLELSSTTTSLLGSSRDKSSITKLQTRSKSEYAACTNSKFKRFSSSECVETNTSPLDRNNHLSTEIEEDDDDIFVSLLPSIIEMEKQYAEGTSSKTNIRTDSPKNIMPKTSIFARSSCYSHHEKQSGLNTILGESNHKDLDSRTSYSLRHNHIRRNNKVNSESNLGKSFSTYCKNPSSTYCTSWPKGNELSEYCKTSTSAYCTGLPEENRKLSNENIISFDNERSSETSNTAVKTSHQKTRSDADDYFSDDDLFMQEDLLQNIDRIDSQYLLDQKELKQANQPTLLKQNYSEHSSCESYSKLAKKSTSEFPESVPVAIAKNFPSTKPSVIEKSRNFKEFENSFLGNSRELKLDSTKNDWRKVMSTADRINSLFKNRKQNSS